MESSIARQRYARRPAAARRRRRTPQIRHTGMRQIIGRQTIICLVLLVMVVIIKNINISATNFIADQVKYVLSNNTELKNVFSYIDKLAFDIKNSVAKKPAAGLDTDEEVQEDNTAVPDNLQDNENAVTEAVKTESAQDGLPIIKTVDESSKTAVLSASNESMTSDYYGMLSPVDGTLSTFYGERTSATGNIKIHKGIDISVKEAVYVKAALDGVVAETGSSPEYGTYIEIRHSNSMSTVYANCSSVNVSQDDNVKRGDIIAGIGGAGAVAGSHLHFEVWVDGVAADPLEYINIPVR